MVATSLESVSNWKAVLAAMLYFATFLSVVYGVYSLIGGAGFFKSVAVAYPFAFAACAVLFVCSVAVESVKTSIKKSRDDANRLPVHSYVHH
jgi:archaellum biogenesis protein FlaJ (TadC family)